MASGKIRVLAWSELSPEQQRAVPRLLSEVDAEFKRGTLRERLAYGFEGFLSRIGLGAQYTAPFYAFRGSKPVGFVAVNFREGSKKSMIHSLFVSPSFRGRGIGGRLAERGILYALSRNVDRIEAGKAAEAKLVRLRSGSLPILARLARGPRTRKLKWAGKGVEVSMALKRQAFNPSGLPSFTLVARKAGASRQRRPRF